MINVSLASYANMISFYVYWKDIFIQQRLKEYWSYFMA